MLEYLNSYFDKFIKQYHPYENDEIYQILIKFIQDVFLVDSYDVIPTQLKTLYEDHTLIEDLYDIVLESLGYGKEILATLTLNQKKIIINNFTDYHVDKGDLKSCIKICTLFNEPINLYELYIDYRVSTNLFDWYFIPRPLKLNQNIDSDSIVPISYDEIYYGTPSYFVSKASLNNAYINKSIKLPLKSNLILLEVDSISDSDEITNLLLATTLFYFKTLEFSITFNQKQYSITLMGMYQLWNYLLISFYNSVASFKTSKPIIIFNLENDDFQYTLDTRLNNNVQDIVEEYNNLTTRSEILSFYDTKFKTVFLDYITPQINTVDAIRRTLAFNIDSNLMDAVDKLTDVSTAESIASALVDLRNSYLYMLDKSADPLLIEYGPLLLNVFDLAIINPLNTATFKLINYFKPYHTQLISKFKYGVKYKSKFTNALVEQTVMFVTHIYEASACVISTDVWFSEKLIGECEFVNSTTVIVSENIASRFDAPWDNRLYWEDTYSRYPTTISQRVVSKELHSEGYWALNLEAEYTGVTGVFDYCYIRYK